ncbi:Sodium/proton antiporter 1 [Glycine soja]
MLAFTTQNNNMICVKSSLSPPIQTKDGFLLGLQRVSSSSLGLGYDGERGPPVLFLLLHGLFMAGDHAWFINTPDQSLGFILADHGFDVWVGNVRGTRWSHGDLAMYDLAEMINYINSVTNAKLLVLGHPQGKMSFAALTQPEIAEKVEQLYHKRLPLDGVCTVETSPFFGSSSCRTTPTLLRHNDKARDPTSSLFQPQQSSPQHFQGLAMALLFLIGYAVIIFEEYLGINKSGVGLLMAVGLWVIRSIWAPSTDIAVSELTHASAEVSEIVFFLLGAMTIVEIVDTHGGFKLVTDNITTQNPRLLLWVEQRSLDVFASEPIAPRGQLVFSVSLGALIFVPVFRSLTGLPPYIGMLLGLGMLWIFVDAIHYGESERQKLKVPHALSRIDTQGALFFLGILLSVSSLEVAGILREIANYFDAHVPRCELIASAIGLISAVIDNVPLVAATMGMYDVSSFPQDSEFWQMIALCASTGGSILIIGSAAGVAFMGMEKVDFFWYLRKVSGFALAGYAAGIAAYLALHNLNIFQPTLAEVHFLSGS